MIIGMIMKKTKSNKCNRYLGTAGKNEIHFKKKTPHRVFFKAVSHIIFFFCKEVLKW